MNQVLIQLGEKIHDALRVFSHQCEKDWIRRNLSGGCAVGTYFLWQEATKRGIPALFQAGANHCWLESEGYLYDLTACQYTCPNHVGCSEADLDRFLKVRVMALSELEPCPDNYLIPKEDTRTLPQEKWGSNIYSARNAWYKTSRENIDHINRFWPQGQRIKGYHLEWISPEQAYLFWKGRQKKFG